MTELILVRHGQSMANLERRFAGHSHFALSELGIAQAKKTAEYIFKNFHVDKLYSSDLLRAFNTACPISSAFGMLPIITDTGLREIHAGDWEGYTWDELYEYFPVQSAIWRDRLNECRIDGGETVAGMAERSRKAILDIAKKNDGKTVCITSHATVIRAFETFVRYGDLEGMMDVPWPTNASVSRYKVDGEKIIGAAYSEDEHLGDMKENNLKAFR